MIRIRFVGGNDIVAAGIRAASYGHWATHAEAVLPDGSLLGAHYDGGVLIRPAGYDKGQYRCDQIVTIPVDDATTQVFHAWLHSQLGKPYDIEAIAAFVLDRNWQRPDAWFCSELMAAGLVACRWFVSPLATEFNKITPRDLLLVMSGRVNTQGKAA